MAHSPNLLNFIKLFCIELVVFLQVNFKVRSVIAKGLKVSEIGILGEGKYFNEILDSFFVWGVVVQKTRFKVAENVQVLDF